MRKEGKYTLFETLSGEYATLRYCGSFSRPFLPLEKGELEGVVEKIKDKSRKSEGVGLVWLEFKI